MTMDYEKKYKEALKKARQLCAYPTTKPFISDLQDLFPELKESESEDEKIRKFLHHTFTVQYLAKDGLGKWHGEPVSNILAWLEKQGEQKSKNESTDTCDSLIIKSKGFPASEKRDFGYFSEAADKVESKFKVGDWVVSPTGVYWHIDRIENNRYEVTSNTGESSNWSLDANIYHRFTIQDAKDGDVLIDVYGNIGIYKSHNDFDWMSYCSLRHYGFRRFQMKYKNEKTYPATKKQYDTLMKAMADAGYEFDFEKKELNKIESDLTEFENTLADVCRGWIGEELGWKDYIIKNSLPLLELAKKQFDEYEQKPADKVEPKFKVGNWYQCTKDFFGKGVTFDKNTAYYCAQEGCLQNEYGCHIAIVKDLYDNFKLWSINDAKDGDVLAEDPIKDYSFPFVAIYKEQNKEEFNSYCFIGFDGNFYEGENGHSTEEVHPATKEQCDTLFAKMKESGYEWDAEKKKLEKIENKKPLLSDFFKAEYERGKADAQKPAWSEEDETGLTNTIIMLKEGASLHFNKKDITKAIDWLKSLRPQKQWKPSEEQMIALRDVISGCSYDIEPLVELETKLKEL